MSLLSVKRIRMTSLKVWFFKALLGKRMVMVVKNDGAQIAKALKYTSAGKAFVELGSNLVAFLDNPKQKEGEFRKNVSTSNLVKWFDL